jgi:hypothetical protein
MILSIVHQVIPIAHSPSPGHPSGTDSAMWSGTVGAVGNARKLAWLPVCRIKLLNKLTFQNLAGWFMFTLD